MLLATRRVLTAEQAQMLRELRPQPRTTATGIWAPRRGTRRVLLKEGRVALPTARQDRPRTATQTEGPARAENASAKLLECGSLLPLSARRACSRELNFARVNRRQQAGSSKSGSKLPHSKAPHTREGRGPGPTY